MNDDSGNFASTEIFHSPKVWDWLSTFFAAISGQAFVVGAGF
jgi:hypothetical protein